eukprot:gene20715-21408_t
MARLLMHPIGLRLAGACFASLVLGATAALAASATQPKAAPADDFSIPDAGRGPIDVDTGNLFGFTDGATVQDEGEKELSTSLVTRWGKRGDGSASDAPRAHATIFETEMSFEYGVTDRLSLAFSAFGTGRDQVGLAGMDDRHGFDFNGLSVEVSYGILERNGDNPFGLAVSVEPSWQRHDDVDGSPQTDISAEFKLAFDWRVLPGQLWYGFNIGIEPGVSRSSDGTVEHQSEVTISNAVSTRLSETTYVGLEAGYHLAYDGLFADRLTGDALYVGPTLFHKFNRSRSARGTPRSL